MTRTTMLFTVSAALLLLLAAILLLMGFDPNIEEFAKSHRARLLEV